jgi:hypothetical protein
MKPINVELVHPTYILTLGSVTKVHGHGPGACELSEDERGILIERDGVIDLIPWSNIKRVGFAKKAGKK